MRTRERDRRIVLQAAHARAVMDQPAYAAELLTHVDDPLGTALEVIAETSRLCLALAEERTASGKGQNE